MKKTILYVGNEYRMDSYICEELEKKYNLAFYNNLDSKVIDIIRQSRCDRKFDILITNMPPNAVRYSPRLLALTTIFTQVYYHDSLNILKEIKRIMNIPILIYTSADDLPQVDIIFLEVGDDIVHKSGDREKDSQKIHDALGRLLEKYEKIASSLQI